jgi:hypothetical protein
MNMIDFVLGFPFWIVSLAFSVFYGAKATTIFFDPASNQNQKTSWKFHQFWLNFSGSFIGWMSLFYLLTKFNVYLEHPLSVSLDVWDGVCLIFAFIGITGLLPWAVGQNVSRVRDLGDKLLPKSK